MDKVRFTTTLKTDLVLRLKHDAIERGICVNKILEDMAAKYYADKDKARAVTK